jgi:AraC-like DNA-binding protein
MSLSTEIQSFMRLTGDTLRFEYQSGAVTPIRRPHSTGWRRVAGLATAQVLNGRIRLQLEGRATAMAKPGETLVLPPNHLHHAELITPGQACSRWSHVNFYILDSVDVFSLFDTPGILRQPASEEVGSINAELAAIETEKSPSLQSVFRKKALGFRLLSLLVEASTLKPGSLERLTRARRVAPALTYIHERIADDLSRERLAALVHLSPSRFQAVFRDALGIAPRDYIQRHRVRTAQQLLVATDFSVREVAQRVGHADAFHFSRAFKKAVGVSPVKYRQRARPGAM